MRFDVCSNFLSENSLCVFLLHGVVKNSNYHYRNFNRKHILAEEFDFFLETLMKNGTPVSMDNLIEYSNEKMMPENAFAITFDDGFENNLSVAAPILKQYNVPATFYLTTDFVANNTMSWIDRIDWAFEQSVACPLIEISVPWRKIPVKLEAPSSRLSFLNEIRKTVKNDRSINQHKLSSSIQRQLGYQVVYSGTSEIDTKLNWEDVKCLEQCDLFTIGGHTHSHPIMSFLSETELLHEIGYCLSLLKKHAGITTKHFAYPEGMSNCYNQKVIKSLKSFGIKCCPTAEHGVNQISSKSDLFKLKRIFVD